MMGSAVSAQLSKYTKKITLAHWAQNTEAVSIEL